jgi:hypothetical protein
VYAEYNDIQSIAKDIFYVVRDSATAVSSSYLRVNDRSWLVIGVVSVVIERDQTAVRGYKDTVAPP